MNTQQPVHLYTFANSPFGAKVYWALIYKQIEFEITYVNPITTSEIRFSKQGIVPVLQVGDDWVQDSRENCLRLEKLYPNRPFAGSNDEERSAVVAADQWVTDNIVALHFFSIIDTRAGAQTKRNAMRMANVILPTSPGIPEFVKKAMIPFWPLMLRSAGFVKRAANMLDTRKDLATLHKQVLDEFESRLSKTGFLAGTEDVTFADIAAFAEVTFTSTHGFEDTLNVNSSKTVKEWYDKIVAQLPSNPNPALFPSWPPIDFNAQGAGDVAE